MMNNLKSTLYNVPLTIEFEIGRTKLQLGEVMQIKKGTSIQLDDSVKGNIKIYLNGERFGSGLALKKDGDRYVEITEMRKKER
jgi:flagellar motor switch protein FliN